ncbi:MAG: penicillin-binding protein 2, partial [Xanthomonadales bacterium]|nr:penicillin-binding protein 2 [Xanthomonadales bacterium]
FGFGQPTGIDLPAEASGILPTREWKQSRFKQPWYPGETIIAAIGQGYNVTTILQLAVATAAIANGGDRLQPQLLRAVQPVLDEPPQLAPHEPAKSVGVTDPSHFTAVIAGMHAVVQGPTGSARAIGDAPYQFAGKTGTAQRSSRAREGVVGSATRLRNQALFVAFAPLEQPQIAVALVVEAGDSGSRTAAPIARHILDAWMLRSGQQTATVAAQ